MTRRLQSVIASGVESCKSDLSVPFQLKRMIELLSTVDC